MALEVLEELLGCTQGYDFVDNDIRVDLPQGFMKIATAKHAGVA